jgi:hypothetical protein
MSSRKIRITRIGKFVSLGAKPLKIFRFGKLVPVKSKDASKN